MQFPLFHYFARAGAHTANIDLFASMHNSIFKKMVFIRLSHPFSAGFARCQRCAPASLDYSLYAIYTTRFQPLFCVLFSSFFCFVFFLRRLRLIVARSTHWNVPIRCRTSFSRSARNLRVCQYTLVLLAFLFCSVCGPHLILCCLSIRFT